MGAVTHEERRVKTLALDISLCDLMSATFRVIFVPSSKPHAAQDLIAVAK